jgi:hypothetical protein
MKYFSIYNRPSSAGVSARNIRGVAFFLIAFHLLAVGRAFVPGLCATQEALRAAAGDAQACPTEAVSCCAINQDAPQGPGYSTPIKKGPSCAFCHLVLAHVLPTVPAADSDAPGHAPERGIAIASAPSAAEAASTNLGRDPPFYFSA